MVLLYHSHCSVSRRGRPTLVSIFLRASKDVNICTVRTGVCMFLRAFASWKLSLIRSWLFVHSIFHIPLPSLSLSLFCILKFSTEWNYERTSTFIESCKAEPVLWEAAHSRHYSSFIHQWLYSPLLGPGLFFIFVIFFTDGRTPWTGDQPVARPLPTHRTTQVGFEPTIPSFERAKMVDPLDRAATVISRYYSKHTKYDTWEELAKAASFCNHVADDCFFRNFWRKVLRLV
jgi:hypothetical protein